MPSPTDLRGLRFLTLEGAADPETFIPDVLPWVHEAGNPFFDWLFGGERFARLMVEQLMRHEAAELAVRRVSLLLEDETPVGGFIAIPGQELARCRLVDGLTTVKEAERQGIAGLRERMTAGRDLFSAVEPDELYLSKLAVVPERRGQGLGRALLERFLTDGREAGFDRFRLDVAEDNVVAFGLYESSGFQVAGRRELDGMRYAALTLEGRSQKGVSP